jgi:uncharacterized membrane protein
LLSYYAPWGITSGPIVLILIILTTAFTFVAVFRERAVT